MTSECNRYTVTVWDTGGVQVYLEVLNGEDAWEIEQIYSATFDPEIEGDKKRITNRLLRLVTQAYAMPDEIIEVREGMGYKRAFDYSHQ